MRALAGGLVAATNESMSKEQSGFKKEISCTDQIFAIKINVENYQGKGWKLFAVLFN